MKKDIKMVISDNQDKIESIVIDGKNYKRRKNEKDIKEFYQRVRNEILESENYDLNNYWTNENVKKQSVTEYKEASKNLRKKMRTKAAAAAVAGIVVATPVAATTLSGCSNNDQKNAKITAEEQEDEEVKTDPIVENEQDEELKRIYEELLQYSDGREIVETLQLIDETQDEINTIAIANPDEKDKVSVVDSYELAAIYDVYNARTDKKTLLESEEIGRCYYFTGQANLINLSQGARDVQEIDELIFNDEVRETQIKLQDETQNALNNFEQKNKSFRKLANKIYSNRNSLPESQLELAFGQPGLELALNGGVTGKALKNYQEASKRDGAQANRLFKEAYSDSKSYSVENGEINLDKQLLINDALDRMNEKNYKNEYDNTDYNPSTTRINKELLKDLLKDYENGALYTDGNGNYYQVNKTSKKTTRKKISRKEAVEKYGEKAVEKAEDKADHNTKVDTDGDGKVDTPMDEANKTEKDNAKDYSNGYVAGYTDGQNAFLNNGSSTGTTSKGSSSYKSGYESGYKAGYNNAKSVYDKKQEDLNKKPVEETYTKEPQTNNNNTNSNNNSTNTKTESKPVEDLKREENTYVEEHYYKETPQAVKSVEDLATSALGSALVNKYMEFLLADGTKVSSTAKVRVR